MPPRVRVTRPAVLLTRIRSGTRLRGQAMVEAALIAPLLLLLIGGIGDLGRAFYYKTAAINVAREAAHWATLPDPRTVAPPTDPQILGDVAPSQESFGLSCPTCTPPRPLELAPPSNVNTNPLAPGNTVSGSANPGPGCGQALCNLQPDHAWLFISPGQAGRTSLAPNAHWTLTAVNSYAVSAPAPDKGGLQQVLRTMGGSLYPQAAEAASGHCFTWSSGLSLSYNTYTIANANATPYQLPVLTVTVNNLTPTGSGNSNGQIILFSVSSPPGAALQQTWGSTQTSQGSVDPNSGKNSDTVSLSSPTAFLPRTYTYQVNANSSGNGCSVTAVANLTVTVQPGPSPSPSPTPSASPSSSPAPSPSPSGSPPGGIGPGPQPHGETITCTVIYYFSPVTPLVFNRGNAFYIVGTATLQATY
jgi:TadE-like protein